MVFTVLPAGVGVAWLGDSLSDALYSPFGVRQGLHRAYIAAQYGWVDGALGVDFTTSTKRSAIANSTVEDGPAANSTPMIKRYATAVLSYFANVAFIMAGANDCIQNATTPASYTTTGLTNDLVWIATEYLNNNCQVAILSMPPITPAGVTGASVAAFQTAIANAATTAGVTYVDISAMPSGYLLSDGVHLSTNGAWYVYQRVAAVIPPVGRPLLY